MMLSVVGFPRILNCETLWQRFFIPFGIARLLSTCPNFVCFRGHSDVGYSVGHWVHTSPIFFTMVSSGTKPIWSYMTGIRQTTVSMPGHPDCAEFGGTVQ